MRIGLGILEPDAGEVRWPGHPVRREEQRGFGYMPEERGLYPKMRADRQLRYLAELHGQSPRDAAAAVQRWSERLRRRLDQPAGRGHGARVGRRRDRLRALRAQTEGAFVGVEGMRRFLADTAETFGLFKASYTDLRDAGDERLVAIGRIRMRGRGSGVEADVLSAAVVQFRNGVIRSYKDYADARRALQEATSRASRPVHLLDPCGQGRRDH